MMDETTVEDVLDHYGISLPQGIGRGAYHHKSGDHTEYPNTLVTLRELEGNVLGDRTVRVEDPSKRDGVLVKIDGNSDRDWWALPEEDVIQGFVASVVRETSFVVAHGDDQYVPDVDDDPMLCECARYDNTQRVDTNGPFDPVNTGEIDTDRIQRGAESGFGVTD